MLRTKKRSFVTALAALFTAIFAGLGLTGCSTTEPLDPASFTAIIDVRTPAEFASGHLDGAVNIDVQSADFDAVISTLDPAGNYFVYCRSGNRSGQAIDRMSSMGFTSMVNGGSVSNAAGMTGLAVVTG